MMALQTDAIFNSGASGVTLDAAKLWGQTVTVGLTVACKHVVYRAHRRRRSDITMHRKAIALHQSVSRTSELYARLVLWP